MSNIGIRECIMNIREGSVVKVFQEKKKLNYTLVIFKEKGQEIYRITNLDYWHICPCKFNSLRAVAEELLEQQELGKITILSIY